MAWRRVAADGILVEKRSDLSEGGFQLSGMHTIFVCKADSWQRNECVKLGCEQVQTQALISNVEPDDSVV